MTGGRGLGRAAAGRVCGLSKNRAGGRDKGAGGSFGFYFLPLCLHEGQRGVPHLKGMGAGGLGRTAHNPGGGSAGPPMTTTLLLSYLCKPVGRRG